MSRIYARANLRCCSLRTGTVVAVQNRTWALLFGGVRLPRKRLRARIKCRHEDCVPVCCVVVFQKEGENRSHLKRASRYFSSFCFFVFWFVELWSKKSSHRLDLSSRRVKSSLLFVLCLVIGVGGVLVLLLFFCS